MSFGNVAPVEPPTCSSVSVRTTDRPSWRMQLDEGALLWQPPRASS